ncbi:hypothetical protein GCM10025865_01340 [Paraoerskovia sediminicola]|uniref:N-acetylmuramoyl-L-alanine amidase domain-containing protein n=1 Tax=Paraoerskovia sediminicola TaxID=1138587 RepID=A0ABN6X7R9_9CELL|nr:peptidoglycan-binding domain-containing protein [Paraoerskovia sediminicola]BDZ40835.1 hypothetical protein GCM10025865_01340 [Paraoerskovia sediminicola]
MAQDWMPGAIKRPVSWAQSLSRHGVKPNKFVVHITAGNGSAASTGNYFERSKVACSTFCTDKDGTIYQFQPVSARSGADYGSNYTVSNENVGTNGPLTQAQIVANAKILRWLHEEHGVSLRIISTSAKSQSGLGSHRFGVDGNFPLIGIQRGRLQRFPIGEKWSGARGKTCPTNAAQEQLPSILALASVSGGGGASVPSVPSKPVAPSKPSKLAVDGKYGPATVSAKQADLGTTVDGIVSGQSYWIRDHNPGLKARSNWKFTSSARGSDMIRADQKRLKKKGLYKDDIDGLAGPNYWKAVQREQGTTVDGYVSEPSSAVKAIQRDLND